MTVNTPARTTALTFRFTLGAVLLGVAVFGFALPAGAQEPGAAPAAPVNLPVPDLVWILPFVLLLLAIAILPLVPATHHWWERNRSKLLVAVVLALVVLGYYGLRGFGTRAGAHATHAGAETIVHVLEHAVLGDYVPFIVLLFSLYTISGGISVRGDIEATPLTNTTILALGTLLASFIGTTGASMLLIRPLLEINSERRHVRHTVIFFIFLVGNIGGSLLPLGDPPLFLGYLRGVPFLWTLTLWEEWLLCSVVLLAVYYVWDRFAHARETPEALLEDATVYRPLRVRGALNFVWLAGVVLSVALLVPGRALPGTNFEVPPYLREAVLLALTGLAYATTSAEVRTQNGFNFAAIGEVAALFLGIFITMQVPVEILQARGPEMGLRTPTQFFWATGVLSSFLDNAPTYVVFFQTAGTLDAGGAEVLRGVETATGAIPLPLLTAVSLGSVFMGANTYIGNGPNFMVKSIAEQAGVRMPSFFGYMLYSGAILLPLFVLVTFIFLS
ncbi:MAG: sodium:proton antiporter [Gemmataceae bacterium]|nr:sodium:proton antiporter [Gemmataceae bacterium]